MSKDKATQRGNAILVAVAMVMGVLIGLMFSRMGERSQREPESVGLQGKMDEVMQLVENNYVEPVDIDSLSEHLVAVLLSELDPHSSYLSVRESEHTAEMLRGNFEGVGLVLHREGDTSFVGQVLRGGPSDGLDVMPGDAVVAVDGQSVVGQPSDSVVGKLRGPRGTMVRVTLQRTAPAGTADVTIRRGVVDHASIPCSIMLDDTTGYVMLTTFSSTSHSEFRTALRRLKAEGMRHLVFDMRGNSGGALSAATGIAGELLPRGSLIVYTRGEHSPRHNIYARSGGLFTEGRVTVLIDEASASASEVVSGALQDNDRALIVGRRSFGKGLVQADFTLSDGSSVLLTTARYYTPSGRCIQRPYDDGTEEYYRSYVQQLIDESYADTSLSGVRDTTPYHTVGGRVVYGGGGITPDVILPYRKDPTFAYYNRLMSAGVINRTAFGYVRRHAGELMERYTDADAFCRRFTVGDDMIQQMARAGEKAGIALDARSLKAQRPLIATLLKAYIGQSLFGDEVFYRIYRQQDDDLKKIQQL